MPITYFEDVDDCIMAAYRYVRDTGNKVESYSHSDGGDAIGVISADGTGFMMWMESHNTSQKRKLARLIHEHKITVVQFINKQLLPFL
jgi:hypothetical protein